MGTDSLLAWFHQHLYLTLVGGIALDAFGLPIPGESLLLAAGYMVGRGEAGLLMVLVGAALAALAGDSLWYAAGRRGGPRLLALYCRISLGSGQCVRRTQAYFDRFGLATVTLARLVPGLRAMAMPLAGSSHMSWPRFLLYDGTGVGLWVSLYVLLGQTFAHRWPTLAVAVRGYPGTILLVLVVLALGILGLRGWRRKRHGPAWLAPVPVTSLDRAAEARLPSPEIDPAQPAGRAAGTSGVLHGREGDSHDGGTPSRLATPGTP
jgi:membrane protein DedA with SNARE-associated domain